MMKTYLVFSFACDSHKGTRVIILINIVLIENLFLNFFKINKNK